jgi:membrane-associated phospholipid phosphatase
MPKKLLATGKKFPCLQLSDILTFVILVEVLIAISIPLPMHFHLWKAWVFHTGLFGLFYLFIIVLLPRWNLDRQQTVRAVITVAVMQILYRTVGHVAHDVVPWKSELFLAYLDEKLFLGQAPFLWLTDYIRGTILEFFSFFYILFLPFLYTSLVLGCLGKRPLEERQKFLTGVAVVYSVSLSLHLLLPARGPIVLIGGDQIFLLSGMLHCIVSFLVQAAGGPHGAFPSIHVAASAYVCFFELRHAPLRGWIYLPIVILITLSTVFLFYHYVVDVLAGFLIAALALYWKKGIPNKNYANCES